MLLNNNLFNKYPPAEISAGAWNLLTEDRAPRSYAKKTQMLIEHQQVDRLLCIVKGRIKAYTILPSGNEKIFEILEAPSIIGYQALYSAGNEAQYPYISMLEDTDIISVPIPAAEALIDDCSELLRAIFITIKNILNLTRIQSIWNQNLSFVQRTAYALLLTEYTSKDADGFFSITHEDIAGFVGISRSNVTSALNMLYSKNCIDKKFGKIKVLDKDALERLVHEEDA
jgi:CRP/FNR family transcriptional regulator